MLKKWLFLLLALLTLFTLAACDKEEPTTPPSDDPPISNSTPSTPNAPTLVHSGALQDGAITWEIYSDGKMVLKGSGALEDFESAEDQPWWMQGGATWNDRNYLEDDIALVTSLVVEEGITSLGAFAFAEQLSLTSVTLPQSLTALSLSCFQNCPKLSTVSGGKGLSTIGDDAFNGCIILESIELSSALDEVGWCAFDQLRHNSNADLKLKVRFHGTEAQWSAVAVSSGNTALTSAEVTYVTE